MKTRFFLLLFLLGCALQGRGQAPWAPVQAGWTYTYEDCEYHIDEGIPDWSPTGIPSDSTLMCYVQIKVDSFNVIGADSIYYFNEQLNYRDTIMPCDPVWHGEYSYRFYLGYSFLQAQMVKKANGDYHFYNPDTFVLKVNASLNDSWVFGQMDSIISATITRVDTQTVFGALDSIKVISISLGDSIVLSKNWGILYFPNFEGTGTIHNLQGVQKDTLSHGLRIPDFWDYYNYSVGDEFLYKKVTGDEFGSYGCYFKHRILSKAIVNNGYQYIIEKFSGCYSSWNYWIDTIVYNESSTICNDGNFGFEPWYNRESWTYIVVDTGMVFEKVVKEGDFMSTDSCMITENTYRYRKNLGVVIHNYRPHHTPMYSTTRLIAYISNGNTSGTMWTDSMVIISSIESVNDKENGLTEVKLFPNPSPSAQATLQFPQALQAPLHLEVYNLQGQRLYYEEHSQPSAQIELSLPDLSAGLYFIRLSSGGEQHTMKWMIVP